MPYIGASWNKRGGNQRDATYLQNLQKWASADGVLHPRQARQLPPEQQGFLAKLVDFVSREDYAMAGVFDTLAGTGREGEGVGQRFVRELIGGTRLGDALGLEAGDKEDWDRVLEQQGVGVGGRLSDLIGENSVTKYLDPSIRGTGALGISVVASPSTYVGIGLGGRVAKVMGKGGQIALSGAGEALVTQRYFRRIGALAAKHGIEHTDDLARIERKVLAREAEARSMAYMKEWGEDLISQEIRDKAGRSVARGVERGILDADKLTVKSTVRFGDLGLFGSRVRGVDLFETKNLTAPARAVGRAIERAAEAGVPGGRLAVRVGKDFDRKISAIHDLFNAVPRLAKKVPGLETLIQNRNARVRGSLALAEDLVNETVFGGKSNFRKLDEDALSALGDAIEGVRPEVWYEGAARAGFDQSWADDVIQRWHSFADDMANAEVLREMQDVLAIDALRGRYISHVVTGLSEEESKALFKGAVNRGISTGDVGRFAESRYFDTRDELRAFMEANKEAFPNARMVESAHELMVRRSAAHFAGMAEADFIDDMLGLYRATPQRVFRKFYESVGGENLDAVREGASAKELDDIAAILSRSSTTAGPEAARAARKAASEASERFGPYKLDEDQIVKRDLETLRSMRPDLRAAVMREMFSRVESLSHFENLLGKYGPVLKSMGLDRSEYTTGFVARDKRSFLYQGQEIVDHEFTRGRLKGRKVVIPKAVRDSLERMETVYLDSPEMGEMLRLYDRAHNAFKFSVTSMFPAFNTRNAYSNVFSSLLDIGVAAIDPVRHVRAMAIMLGSDTTLRTATGQSIPASAVRRSARALDIWQENLAFADLSPTRSVLSELEANGALAKLRRAVTSPARFVENEARMLHYITSLERGMSFQDAARATKQFLFDYQDLSDTEKRIMRRVVPFYKWTRASVELQLKQLLTNPGRTFAGIRLTDNERGPGPDYLPEFVRGDLKVRLDSQPGKADTFLTGIDIPVGSLNAIWAGGVGLTIRENLSMLSPFLKNPLEYGLDAQAMGANSIQGRQFMGRMGPTLQRRLPKWAREYIGLKEITTSDGRKFYTANGTKTWAILKFPFIGRFVSEGVTAEQMLEEFGAGRGGGAQLLKLMSGLSLREMDLSDAQRTEMRNKIRRIEQVLLDSGEAAEFRRIYDPDARSEPKRSALDGLVGVRRR